jgi:hypothetical protein
LALQKSAISIRAEYNWEIMKLTDNEKREILKRIEAHRPLPDKHRFLLFDDKREVELVWNGKSNEVTQIVLPFQVTEQVDEPLAEKSKPRRMKSHPAGARLPAKGWIFLATTR